MHYFISDVHLGAGSPQESRQTEDRFVEWLDSVGGSAKTIFLNGDIFDFWFEYKRVVPKGFVRTLSRLSELTRRGVRVVFMAGNHDQWVRDYFTAECGVEVYTSPQIFDVEGRRVYLAHGDNLSVQKRSVLLRLMNWGFRSKFIRCAFSIFVHPDLALKFGQWWSRSSRASHSEEDFKGRGKAHQSLITHAEEVHSTNPCDYYVFGHLHITSEHKLEGGARIIFTNDWRQNPHCAVMDGSGNITIEAI